MQTILPGFDFENLGAESDEDIIKISANEIGSSYLWATDWTVGTLVTQILKGFIILDPVFQRRDAWKVDRKSRFIESIILNLPIPQIVLAEKNSKLIVVDGKQRLLSIMQFYGQNDWIPLKLKGLQILDIEGYTYEKIKDMQHGFSFENNTIRTVILKNTPSDNYINLVFNRLNSNSVALSAQELRQSLYSGPFLRFVELYTRDKTYLAELFGNSEPDFRMRDVELLLRHIAFKKYLKSYTGNLKTFLDTTCKKINRDWKTEETSITMLCDELEKSIKFTRDLLGKNSFRKYLDKENEFEYRFNRAIFDVFSFYFSFESIRSSITDQNKFVNEYKGLFSNPEFLRSIEQTTKSIESVKTRFEVFGRFLGVDISNLN